VLYGHQHNFGQGTGPVFLYGVGCTGTESTLLNCGHSGIRFNWCSHSNDGGVVCPCRLYLYVLMFAGVHRNVRVMILAVPASSYSIIIILDLDEYLFH